MRAIRVRGVVEDAFEYALEEANGAPSYPIQTAFVQRGDVVSTRTKHGSALGVYLGGVAAFPGPKGITFLPLKDCLRGWRI